MIDSQGIHNLSRAAGDESLQRMQRVNKDGHAEQDKGGHGRRGKRSAGEKEHGRDMYERTAEDVNVESSTKDSALTVNSPAVPGQVTEKTKKKITDSGDKILKEPGAADAGTPGGKSEISENSDVSDNSDHIDLMG